MIKPVVLVLCFTIVSAALGLAAESNSVPSSIGVASTVLSQNPAGGPLLDLVQPLLVRLSVLVGGIFGLYIILLAFRVYYERRNLKTLEAIRYDLDQWNEHHGVNSSRHRTHIFHRLMGLGKSIVAKKQKRGKKK